jgi:DNA-binding NtrC family response regulator
MIDRVYAMDAIVGESEAMRNVRSMIAAAAPTALSVLVTGPTGSGKELVARALHEVSGRRGSLVAFNVCAIGEAVFEAALFGHVRGAFTGAFADAPGFLREADGGTVFLDEIGAVGSPQQAKLLRAIETGEFRPVGARSDARSDFRVVSATNDRIDSLVQEGRFRADLAHRVAAVTIRVPSLAERREDVALLAAHFASRFSGGNAIGESSALRRLEEAEWPGNVRELKNVVEWALTLGGGLLSIAAVEMALATRARDQVVAAAIGDRQSLRAALDRHEWHVPSAARELGVDRATVYRRMKRFGVRPPMPEAAGF